jgi:hypothetical protein
LCGMQSYWVLVRGASISNFKFQISFIDFIIKLSTYSLSLNLYFMSVSQLHSGESNGIKFSSSFGNKEFRLIEVQKLNAC